MGTLQGDQTIDLTTVHNTMVSGFRQIKNDDVAARHVAEVLSNSLSQVYLAAPYVEVAFG